MKRTFATLTMLVAGILTVSLPNEALAELTFGEWATAEDYTPPGPIGWWCRAEHKGITSADGVSSYANLQGLILWGNQISSLAPDQFQGLTNLHSLSLNGNQISTLADSQFQGLTNLESLFLAYNQISTLAPNQFQDLADLRDLLLPGNQISALDANQFQGLINLESLDFSDNQISSLDANQFQGLTNLRSLRFYANQISMLAADQFQGLINLESLNLSFNQISSLDANQFTALTNLRTLDFSGNQVSTLAANQFQDLTHLGWLILGKNQISTLAPNQFQGLADLEALVLDRNQISSLDLTGFEATALRTFDIAVNPIIEVILADSTLSQTTFDLLMIGYGNPAQYVNYIGIAELSGIGSLDFTAADMAGVDQFDEMFAMADLQTLILTDVLFSEAIVADGYAEVWDLISALDSNRLDALTVDGQLYTAMQTNLDTWDAGPGNVLTVVPEPSTLALLAVAGLALLLWRRRA